MANKHLEPLGDEWGEGVSLTVGAKGARPDPSMEHLPEAIAQGNTEDVMRRMLGNDGPANRSRRSSNGGPCGGCGKRIQGPSMVDHRDGKRYHNSCYQGKITCEKCGKDIRGHTVTTSSNTHYHFKCFTCTSCDRQIGQDDGYTEANGQPFCRRCTTPEGAEDRSRKVGRLPSQRSGSKRKAGASKAAAINEAAANVQRGKESCSSCGKAFGVEEIVQTPKGDVFHPACFTCDSCGKAIGSGGFSAKNGKYVCKSCTQNQGPKCNKCGKPITGVFLKSNGKTYHEDCYN